MRERPEDRGARRAAGAASQAGVLRRRSGALALVELQDEIRLVTGLQRGLVGQREADSRATKTRLGAASDLAREREEARVMTPRDPLLAEADQRLARLMAELRKRCPGGTSVRDGVQVCLE